jgi:hypothetical protein
VQYTNVYQKRKDNFDVLKAAGTQETILGILQANLPKNCGVLRYHVGGDFFNATYFNAAVRFAISRPDVLFYAYTKSLALWASQLNNIPANFVLTASYGGKLDSLIETFGFRLARVVFSQYEARKLGLPIDHNDSHAADPSCGDFALLLHGTQPAGSKAGKAWSRIKKTAGGYKR